ncbi:zinc-binding dehydrogenase [Paenarthrobacter nicotinovorans]|uniref:zinc-binding dehydrogenase n=1 Tax=Paenarthrobacter nicotinovorans TaxID=29320 RepID=UPI003D67BE6D
MTSVRTAEAVEQVEVGIRAQAALVTNRADGRFTIAEIELPALRSGEVLVQVKAAGLCHSDWNFISDERGNPWPALLGHEFSGVASVLGPGVRDISLNDHVVACAVPSCGRCINCISGSREWCAQPEVSRRAPNEPARIFYNGRSVWQLQGLGGFAEYTIVHESQLVAVNKSLPFDRAAVLGCAVVSGAGSVMHVAKVQPGETVTVIGAGGVGLNAIQAASLVGAQKIIAVDVDPSKLRLARKFGATETIDASKVDTIAEVRALTGGRGVDHAFEMTGLLQPLQQGFEILAKGGTVYQVGMQRPGTTFPLPVAEINRGSSIRLVLMGSTNFKVDIPFYAELYAQGRLNLDDLIERSISLDEINTGYERLLSGGGAGRTVLNFS